MVASGNTGHENASQHNNCAAASSIVEAAIVNPTLHEVGVAQRLVIVHQPEDWPTGWFCQNCKARWPCRLNRWGIDILLTTGWAEPEIAELLRRAKVGEVLWA